MNVQSAFRGCGLSPLRCLLFTWTGVLTTVFLLMGLLSTTPLGAADPEPFPAAIDGEHYYCPRIDRISPLEGGPLTIELDGVLDDPAWQRAAYQGYYEHWKGGQVPADEFDFQIQWAAVADAGYLYVAWKIQDDFRQSQSEGCGNFNDDAMEIYFNAKGDNLTCDACGYSLDDVQLIVGTDTIGLTNPAELQVGWVRAGGCAASGMVVDGSTGEPAVLGVVAELESEEGISGWQGEIAIALENMGPGQWKVDPSHGTLVGWDIHVDDDDVGGGQDATTSALIWSKRDGGSQAWRTPGVWGKLQFISPGKPLVQVVRDIDPRVQNGSSGPVTIKVTPDPIFGFGEVVIEEELPSGLTPSAPSPGGVLANNTITWNLGVVNEEVTVSYTLAAAADMIDVALPGRATIEEEPVPIYGDAAYTGSPYDSQGFIKLWNHLGPLASGLTGTATCNTPDLALDWIVNEGETVQEADIQPFPGMVTRPRYGGDGLIPGTGARATGVIRPGGATVQEPVVWKAGLAATDAVDHASVHGFDAEEHVTLSAVYVTNPNAPVETVIGVSSDDSIQVYLGNQPQPLVSACRGLAPAGGETDFFPVTLPSGETRLLVKVSDGTGGSGFRLRFQTPNDPLGPGLLPPDLTVSLESFAEPPLARVVRSFSSDTFGTGGSVLVSLETSARGAPAVDIELVEPLPGAASPSDISAPGSYDVTGHRIVWSLSGVSSTIVSYRLTPDSCVGALSYSGATWRVGVVEALTEGSSTLTRAPVGESLAVWESSDINSTGGGAEALGEHQVLIEGEGNGVESSSDGFRFVRMTAPAGDFAMTARLDCADDPGGVGQIGLMLREGAQPSVANAFFFMTPTAAGGGTLKGSMRRDSNPGRTTQPIVISARDVTSLPIYMKLERKAGRVTFARSSDGITYTEVAGRDPGTGTNQLNFNPAVPLLVGLAISGNDQGSTRATFSEVSGPSFTVPAGPTFRRGNVNGDALLDISDAIGILGFLFLGQADKVVCVDAADIKDKGSIDISDAISVLNFLFQGGTAPAAPGPETCGRDVNQEAPDLGCAQGC